MSLRLEKFKEENIKLTFDWIQDKEFRHLFLMNGEPDWENHVKYFETILKDKKQKVFAIFYDDSHIGNCGLKNLEEKQAELWIYIGDNSYKSKGLGKKACEKLMEFGFKNLKLEKIYLHLANFNIIAQNLYKKLGFAEIELNEESKKIWGNKGIDVVKMESQGVSK